jgi:hypothetical protein
MIDIKKNCNIKKLKMKYLVLKLNDKIDIDYLIIELTKVKLLNLKLKYDTVNINDIALIILNSIIKK